MKFKFLVAVAALFAMAQSGVQAAPITYQGTLQQFMTASGSVGGFSFFDNDAANSDFWSFSGFAGQLIGIRVARGNPALDPAASLFLGTTTADESQFVYDASFGGMTFLALADDEIDVMGPFGDPYLTFVLPVTGQYTVVVGGLASDGEGPFPYTIQLQVPLPATLPLLALGLSTLGFSLRRQR